MTTIKSTKICAKCKTSKILKSFCKNIRKSDGYNHLCKECVNKKLSELRKIKNFTIKESDKKRFVEKIHKTDYCWVWLRYKLPKGYGVFYLNNNAILAHRFSYLYHFGNLPQNLDVLHHCDNPSCVNPTHLFLGTNQDNINDKVAKGRQRKGGDIPSAKITEKEVIEIRERARNGENSSSITNDYPVSPRNIRFIIQRKTWKHI